MDTKALIETADHSEVWVVFQEVAMALEDAHDDYELALRAVKMRFDDGTVDHEYPADAVAAARAWWADRGVAV